MRNADKLDKLLTTAEDGGYVSATTTIPSPPTLRKRSNMSLFVVWNLFPAYELTRSKITGS